MPSISLRARLTSFGTSFSLSQGVALGFQYAEAFAVAQHELRDADFPGFAERFAQ
jgi:hypothetical protein